jgi:mono/diheme cytochrome c family protein
VYPRGIAYDASLEAIHVACAGGELVSYAASSGTLLRKVRLQRDLRDVVVDGNRLLVSRFRAAELLVVESNGTVSATLKPPASPFVDAGEPGVPPGMINAVAWRTVPSPDGGALMVYQTLRRSLVRTTPGGYGGSCGSGIIGTAVSLLRVGQPGFTILNVPALLPIDLATQPSRMVAVASAAWTPGSVNRSTPTPFFTFLAPQLGPVHVANTIGFCGPGIPPPPPVLPPDARASDALQPPSPSDAGVANPVPTGRVIALAYAGPSLVLQTREPATLVMGGRSVELPGRSRKHTGHELFHLGTMGGIACASCHPEGGEDGQVWNFSGLGQRRTQNISGGISGTEPFHWSGDMETFSKLAHDVFQGRMSGPQLGEQYVDSLFRWIDKIPSMEPPAPDDPAAVERGKAVFHHADVGCATCHSGERLTNNGTFNVQTGGPFQVPSLRGLAWRAPYMHTGCAPTLDARFDACGGGDAHGKTSQLTPQERADLVAYLDSL